MDILLPIHRDGEFFLIFSNLYIYFLPFFNLDQGQFPAVCCDSVSNGRSWYPAACSGV